MVPKNNFFADPAPRLGFHIFLYVFLCTIYVFFSGFVFSPVVWASLVGLLADAPDCRGLEALADLVVSAGCLRQ
jgi:hypothetical protein